MEPGAIPAPQLLLLLPLLLLGQQALKLLLVFERVPAIVTADPGSVLSGQSQKRLSGSLGADTCPAPLESSEASEGNAGCIPATASASVGGSPATASQQKAPSCTGARGTGEMRLFSPAPALPASAAWRAGSILSFSHRAGSFILLFTAKKLLLLPMCPNSRKRSFLTLSPRRGSTGTGCTRCHELCSQVSSCLWRQVCLQSLGVLLSAPLRGCSQLQRQLWQERAGGRRPAGSRLKSGGGWEARAGL